MNRIATWCAQSVKAVADIGEKEFGLVSKRDKLPGGFLVERYLVDVIGICAKCQPAQGWFLSKCRGDLWQKT